MPSVSLNHSTLSSDLKKEKKKKKNGSVSLGEYAVTFCVAN